MSQIWIMWDQDPGCPLHPARRIRLEQAKMFNEQGYGIFWTVQEFAGLTKAAKHLSRINAWAVDLDKGTKEEQRQRIAAGPWPSRIVETKNGFHVYWRAIDAKPEHYKAIVADRMVPFYDADPKAKDLSRILRVPGFYHMKDPKNPFLVEEVFYRPQVAYTERQIVSFFPDVEEQKESRKVLSDLKREFPKDGDFWERIWNLNCEYALERLSGHPAVGSETFSFKPNASGTKNIYVNGKGSSCWIDRNGRIGSFDKGGPTIAQWLRWYGLSWPDTILVLKEVFPELRTEKKGA